MTDHVFITGNGSGTNENVDGLLLVLLLQTIVVRKVLTIYVM